MSGAALDAGYQGQQDVEDTGSDTNALSFIVGQIINRLATTAVVRVTAVTNNGGVSPIGQVDVQPLVNQIDGAGNATPHGTINSLAYFRLQGGANAVILDPKVGDVGFAVFCSRDISAVKATGAQANPGSRRRYDWADGIYVGMWSGVTPTSFVRFADNGDIEIRTPGTVTFTAPLAIMTGELRVDGEITGRFGGSSVSLTGHVHPQPDDSGGDHEVDTGPPVPGT